MSLPGEIVWDVFVNAVTLDDVITAIDDAVTSRTVKKTIFCANPHSLVIAHADPEFMTALQRSDVLLPDGIGIVLASKIKTGIIKHRVSGTEIFELLAHRWNQRTDRSFFFLGASPEVLQRMKARMATEYPNVVVCGCFAPPIRASFTEEETLQMINAINASAPDVLWVGMTAPKQEKWIFQNRKRLHVPAMCAVGATFDFFAGTKKRAPAWLRNMGLEWLPRLVREPRRLWRRNFISTPVFLVNAFRDAWRRN